MKLRLLGLLASCPELTPVPDIATVTVDIEPEAELVFFPPELWVLTMIDTLPLSAPVEGGVNMTVHVTLCPPASVIG